ncbi:MAG: site-2 protease family protein [Rhodospirillaceae bacterium]
MFGLDADWFYTFSTWVLPVLVAITFHEAAHGFVAWRLGDPTARMAGRLSFNPLRHIDPFGTVVLPAMLFALGGIMFGWAKPVPVDFRRLNNPRRDMVWVAIAGPATNLALAVVAVLSLHAAAFLPEGAQEWTARNLINALQINLILALFNMLPIPPLDGGRVAVGLLPDSLAYPLARLERTGMVIILGVAFLLPFLGQQIGVDLNVFYWLIGMPAMELGRLLLTLAGLV